MLICCVLWLGICLSDSTVNAVSARFNNKKGDLSFDDFLQIVCRIYSVKGASAILLYCYCVPDHWLTEWRIDWQLTYLPASQLASCPIDHLTNLLTVRLTNWPTTWAFFVNQALKGFFRIIEIENWSNLSVTRGSSTFVYIVRRVDDLDKLLGNALKKKSGVFGTCISFQSKFKLKRKIIKSQCHTLKNQERNKARVLSRSDWERGDQNISP